MNKKTKQPIEKKELPDWFWVGDKWQVIKQDGKYRILDVAEGGQDRVMTPRQTSYLQALYSTQQHGRDTWISTDEIAALVPSDHDGDSNTHAQHISALRTLFSGDCLIEMRRGRRASAQPTRYQLVTVIRPVEEKAEEKVETNTDNTSQGHKYTRYALGITSILTLSFFLFHATNQTNATSSKPSAISYDLSMRYARGNDETEYVFEEGQTLLSGDRLRLTIRPKKAAYLYLFYTDASKVAHRLFPPAQLDALPRNYQNPVDAEFPLHLPSRQSAYRLDDNSGYDTLTLIATNQAVPQFSLFDQINEQASQSTDSALPKTTELSRLELEQTLTELRHEFAQTCPTCIRTINFVHQ